jgi:hypothetical protein
MRCALGDAPPIDIAAVREFRRRIRSVGALAKLAFKLADQRLERIQALRRVLVLGVEV